LKADLAKGKGDSLNHAAAWSREEASKIESGKGEKSSQKKGGRGETITWRIFSTARPTAETQTREKKKKGNSFREGKGDFLAGPLLRGQEGSFSERPGI